MEKKLLLIINPVSGRTKSKNALFEIIDKFCRAGYLVTVKTTAKRNDAYEFAYNIDPEKYDLIVCSGGDGTLNEVVSGLISAKKNIPLGYVPSGSTNDFANSIGLPTSDLSELIDGIIHGTPRAIDIGCFNSDRYFSYVASFGAFSSTSYTVPQSTKNFLGHLAYVLEGIKDIPNIRPIHAKVVSNNYSCEGDYLFGALINTTSIGGIIKLDNRLVNLNDGLFEVLLIKNFTGTQDFTQIIKALNDSDFSGNMFEFFKTDKVVFNFDCSSDWSLDGEYAKGTDRVNANIIKSGLHIMMK